MTAKKAVINTGGKQYLVTEGETLELELLTLNKEKNVTFDALLVLDEGKVLIGQPTVEGIKVTASVVEQDVKGEKVTAIRYKAKKRVHKTHGHRQHHTVVKIAKIA